MYYDMKSKQKGKLLQSRSIKPSIHLHVCKYSS